MESVTTITPQQAADALGLDLYTLARQVVFTGATGGDSDG